MHSNLFRWLQRILLLVIVIFYPGCTIADKIYIYPDGSGKCIRKTTYDKEALEKLSKLGKEKNKGSSKELEDVSTKWESMSKSFRELMKATLEEKGERCIIDDEKVYIANEYLVYSEDIIKNVSGYLIKLKNQKIVDNDGNVKQYGLSGDADLLEAATVDSYDLTIILPGKIVKASENVKIAGREAQINMSEFKHFSLRYELPNEEILKEQETFKKEFAEAKAKYEKEKEKEKDK